jgi:hypothetical protein
MRRKRAVSHSVEPAPTRFGEIITADHILANSEEAEGILGERTALSIYDLGTAVTDCYALRDKTADEAYAALQDFRGPRAQFDYVYTDNSPELAKALADLGFPHGKSTPGIHETNAHIERRNQTILGGTRTILEFAGFPSCFWP